MSYTTYRDYEPQLDLSHQHTRNCNQTASLTSNGGGLALRLLFSLGCLDFRNINSGPSRIPAVGGRQKREQKERFCCVGTVHRRHRCEMPAARRRCSSSCGGFQWIVLVSGVETEPKTPGWPGASPGGHFTSLKSYKHETDLTSDSRYDRLPSKFKRYFPQMGRRNNTYQY